MIGRIIGGYRIVGELGRGGMGRVYAAEHVQLGRAAAVKMLLPQFSAEPDIVQRFFTEARAAAAIEHPSIVQIYEFGTHEDGRAYIVMERLKGESLEHRLARATMSPLEGANLVAQVASGLAAAHARGIVHRDLKPDNLFLVLNDLVAGGVQVKLLDFGVAKLAGEHGGALKTQTGALIGTPAYMSPEQCMGRTDVDHRSDLYSLGCVLYRILTGRPPFVSDAGTGMIIAAHLRDLAVDPRALAADVSAELAAITLRLLEKDPRARFPDANALRDALVAAGATAPSRALLAASAPATTAGDASTVSPFAPTSASTTGSAGAGEAVDARRPAAPASATPPRRRARWLAGGVALAGAATVALVVARGGAPAPGGATTTGRDVAAAVLAAPGAGPDPWSPAARDVPSAEERTITVDAGAAVIPMGAPPVDTGARARDAGAAAVDARAVTEAACPRGQTRGTDTKGHCCWPDQAWSTAHARCVGRPTCPRGLIAAGERCVAVSPGQASASPEAAPRLTLAQARVVPGATVLIRFGAPLLRPTNEWFWVAIVAAGASDDQYDFGWKWVPESASKLTLPAPPEPGNYEVRLHANYPRLSYHVVARAPLIVR